MHIRIAEEYDLQYIDAIYNQAIEEKLTADTAPLSGTERVKWFDEHEKSSHPVFVYEKDNKVIAWLSFSKYRPGRQALKQTAEISYYVDRDYRKKGFGTELIIFAKQIAPHYGFKNLLAIILDNNTGSIRLLEKCGFKQWGYLPDVADFNDKVCGHIYLGVNL